ncbi:leucyl/phenylalanyl-tRNA--protein transferase [Alteromonas sp. a30]|uniref:leucyl/phenylalanyl-tRNA--protein transferase n=1 Tax=Alteromonas sp. a30 TaxID=2730917 RepID=UPI002281D7CC|nr:leucyl/phenylalanyl-tRNA--protein transferase [Alteromonas sp. a30]MCY7293972.1 leucyl/phenylalanyl-tRNA--protein transferase [Alteromonas sp. a30]
MTIYIYELPEAVHFPDPEEALDTPNGLLACGGDLSPKRLIAAYQQGIFPWFSGEEPILWWSPSPRAVLYLEDYHISRSFSKFLRKTPFHVTLNTAFDEVIETCSLLRSEEEGTWITDDIIEAYQALHRLGHAHSIEVWSGDALVGGLYGVVVGSAYCGESMFHHATNASKLAFYCLVNLLKPLENAFIDCQMPTEHLSTLGVKSIERHAFLEDLSKSINIRPPENYWRKRSLFADNTLCV